MTKIVAEPSLNFRSIRRSVPEVDVGGQASLFTAGGAAPAYRHELADGAWVDVAVGWVPDPDELFALLRATVLFRGHRRRMYDRVVDEPRLTHRWVLPDDTVPRRLRDMGRTLGSATVTPSPRSA